jgi:hypothetical protein
MLGKWAIKASRYGEDAIGVFFRKTREDLKEAIERSKQIYGPIGAKYSDSGKQWVFPDGARLKFQYLERDKDAENYQGHSYTDLFFEELTHWADPGPVNKLKATLRSAKGVPTQFHATGNPGGPGHNWVKARYIDPAPEGYQILSEDFTNPFDGSVQTLERVFIPSKLTDNPLLVEADPNYIAKLQQSGSRELVRAWLMGDWDVVEGAFFDEWSHSKHVVKPFEIPEHWTKILAGDWGSARPFSFGWYAVSDGDPVNYAGGERAFPRGSMIKYREWYGMREDQPNVGLKLTAREVGQRLAELTTEKLHDLVIDPATFIRDGGPSIQEEIWEGSGRTIQFRRADNKRVARGKALGGWDQLRKRLKGDGEQPWLYFFSTCTDSIRTIPVLQHDETKPEDLDTESEDHAADETRYAVMSRPITKDIVSAEKAKYPLDMTINEMIAERTRKRKAKQGLF